MVHLARVPQPIPEASDRRGSAGTSSRIRHPNSQPADAGFQATGFLADWSLGHPSKLCLNAVECQGPLRKRIQEGPMSAAIDDQAMRMNPPNSQSEPAQESPREDNAKVEQDHGFPRSCLVLVVPEESSPVFSDNPS